MRSKGIEASSAALLSDDGAKTWRLSSLVANGNEDQAVALPWKGEGFLHLSMRDASGKGYRWGAESADGGETWTTPWQTIRETACEGSVAALAAAAGGPKLAMSSAFASSRTNLTIHTSADSGKTWAPRMLVYPGGAAYSALVSLNAVNSLGVLFEADCPPNPSPYCRIVYGALSI